MKYIKITLDNIVEIREDNNEESFEGKIILSDEDYDKLLSRNFSWVDGAIVATPQKEIINQP